MKFIDWAFARLDALASRMEAQRLKRESEDMYRAYRDTLRESTPLARAYLEGLKIPKPVGMPGTDRGR